MGHPKDKIENNIVGWRWVAENGENSCARCRALHGKEFYKEPKNGQLSVEKMPKKQIHPNCRCHVEEIYDYQVALREYIAKAGEESEDKLKPVLSTKDVGKGIVFAGLVWKNKGRPFFEGGPAYGRWGGGYWLGGKPTHEMVNNEKYAHLKEHERGRQVDEDLLKDKTHPKPCDDMDKAYKAHDFDYIKGRTSCDTLHFDNSSGRNNIAWEKCNMAHEIAADKKLIRALKALPENVQAWGRPVLSAGQEEYSKRYRAGAIASFEGKIAVYEEHKKQYLERERIR